MENLEYLFVYGVFRDAHRVVHACAGLLRDVVFIDRAFVYGKMYRVNEFYPGFRRMDCNTKVWGDVYLVHPSSFKDLDEFEGDEYERKRIWSSIGEECWIYEYKYPITPFEEIKSGDWILR